MEKPPLQIAQAKLFDLKPAIPTMQILMESDPKGNTMVVYQIGDKETACPIAALLLLTKPGITPCFVCGYYGLANPERNIFLTSQTPPGSLTTQT